jgi:hypothetical protein
MDLFQKLGIRILSWEENMKSFSDEDNKSKYIKEGILKNNEKVLLLEIKSYDEFSDDNFMKIMNYLSCNNVNFIKLKYLLIKNEKEMYFCYENAEQSLMEYLHKAENNLQMKLILYKQAVEIVFYLRSFGETFLTFDHNLFFVNEGENFKPVFKVMYHGKYPNIIFRRFYQPKKV